MRIARKNSGATDAGFGDGASAIVLSTRPSTMIDHRLSSPVIGNVPVIAASDTPGNARTFAVIGPGTGLGVGGLLIRDGRPYPLATEGGDYSSPSR